MRKQYKVKAASCPMCKGHKMGYENRWKPKERELMKLAEEEIIYTLFGDLTFNSWEDYKVDQLFFYRKSHSVGADKNEL